MPSSLSARRPPTTRPSDPRRGTRPRCGSDDRGTSADRPSATRRGFDRGRDFQDRVDPRKSLPSLDRADVHPVQSSQLAQFPLAEVGEAALVPEVRPNLKAKTGVPISEPPMPECPAQRCPSAPIRHAAPVRRDRTSPSAARTAQPQRHRRAGRSCRAEGAEGPSPAS
jgi:hypothetical protein